jgi:hypothetical protein
MPTFLEGAILKKMGWMELAMTTSAKVQAPSMDNAMSMCYHKGWNETKVVQKNESTYQKLAIANNGSKGILSNIIGNYVFPFTGTLQKVYPHQVDVLAIDAIG